MAAKKLVTQVKLNLKGGEASPAPPVGTALGQHGVNIMDFVKAYNDQTSDKKGEVVPVVINIYEDRSFDFITKRAPVSEMIKKELKIKKGSGAAPREIVGTLSQTSLEKIAGDKMEDLNTNDVEMAKNIVAGTARSMGVKVEK